MSDTSEIMALNLPMLDPLPEEVQKYFDICREKLGMVPNAFTVLSPMVLRCESFQVIQSLGK